MSSYDLGEAQLNKKESFDVHLRISRKQLRKDPLKITKTGLPKKKEQVCSIRSVSGAYLTKQSLSSTFTLSFESLEEGWFDLLLFYLSISFRRDLTQWPRLPREVVDAQSLETSQARL